MFLPHRTSRAEAELAEGCRSKKISQALTSVPGSPSVFDAEGSETSDPLSQVQISPLQEWVQVMGWDPPLFGDVPNALGHLLAEGPRGAPTRSPTSQPKMLTPPNSAWRGSPEGFYQGTFSFPFVGRWPSLAVV